MSRFLLTALSCAVVFAGLLASQPTFQWASEAGIASPRTAQPGHGDPVVGKNCLAVDTSGNTFVTGSNDNGSNRDMVTIKYDPSGNEVWRRYYNGTANGWDYGTAISVDSSGNVVALGTAATSTAEDAVVIKYDTNGNQQWIYLSALAGSDKGHALGIDSNDDVCIAIEGADTITTVKLVSATGAVASGWPATFSVAPLAVRVYGLAIDSNDNVVVAGAAQTNVLDALLLKYDTNGAGVAGWPVTYTNGTGTWNEFYDVAIDGSDHVVAAGIADQSGTPKILIHRLMPTGAPATGAWPFVAPIPGTTGVRAVAVDATGNAFVTYDVLAGNLEIQTLGLTPAGGVLSGWPQNYGDPSGASDAPRNIAVDAGGNVVVVGYRTAAGTAKDFVVLRYSNAGVMQTGFPAFQSGSADDDAHGLAIDGSGDIHATGFSRQGTYDAWDTLKITASTGATAWSTLFTGGVFDMTSGKNLSAVDSLGNVIVAGYGIGGSTGNDFVTAKFSQSGALLWQRVWNNTSANGNDYAQAIAIDSDDNIVVTGSSFTLSSSSDFATVKYTSSGVSAWSGVAGNVNGALLWNNSSTNNSDAPIAIAIDNNKSIVVAGQSYDGSSSDFATVKYTSSGVSAWGGVAGNVDGALLWNNTSANDDDYPRAVAIDSNDNVVVVGISITSTSLDYATVKYTVSGAPAWNSVSGNINGALLWNNPSTNNQDDARLVAIDSNDNIVVSGRTNNGLTTGRDFATVKYTPNGAYAWNTVTGNVGGALLWNSFASTTDTPYALGIDSIDNIIVAGTNGSDFLTMKYTPGGGVVWSSVTGNLNGALVWDNNGLEIPSAVTFDGSDNIIVFGQGPSMSGTNVDFAMVQYSAVGNEDWVELWDSGSPNVNDFAYGVHVSGSDIYVTGQSGTATQGGNQQVLRVVKYSFPPNNPPVVATNTGLTLNEGATANITATELETTDADSPPASSLVYTVTTLPINGVLRISTTPITMTGVTFTQDDIDTNKIDYVHNGGETTSDSFGFSVTDGIDNVTGQTFSITVNPVNDAPTIIGPGSIGVNEDTVFMSLALTLADVDAGSAIIESELSATNGTLTLASVTGLTFLSGTSNASKSIIVEGTLAALQAAFGDFDYSPDTDYNGNDAIVATIRDRGNTGVGGPKTDTHNMPVTVQAINDAPSFTKGADQSVNENAGPVSVPAWATSLSTGPSNESTQTLSFNIVSNTNTALFSGGPAVASNGDLSFTPAANTSGVATITLNIMDNGGIANGGVDTSANQSFTITVNAVNDAPTITGPGSIGVNEDTVFMSLALTLADVDAGSAIIEGELSATNGTLTLASVTGLTFLSGTSNASKSIIVEGTLAALQTAFGDFDYSPDSDYNGSDAIVATIRDRGNTGVGGPKTDTHNMPVTVQAINDAPSFTKGSNINVNEDAGPVSMPAWATSLSTGPSDESTQTLSFNIVSNTNTALFSSGPAIAPNGDLSFTPAANVSGSATITINIMDNGGVANGGVDTSANQTFTITVDAVNDAPTVVMSSTSAYTENAPAATLLDSSASVADGDSTDFNTGSLTVDYQLGGQTEDQITIVANANISVAGSTVSFDDDGVGPNPNVTIGTIHATQNGTNGAGLTVTFNGNSSPAAAQALLRTIGFSNSGATPTSTTRVMSVQLSDGDGGQYNGNHLIGVTDVNDAPAITGQATDTATESTPILITSMSVTDPDVGNGVMQLSVSATNGVVNFNSLTGLTIVAGANNSASVTVNGTLAAINASLAAGVGYGPNQWYYGSAQMDFAIRDNGHSGTGSHLDDTHSIAITVVNTPNNPHQVINTALVVAEGGNGIITQQELEFDDHDGITPGNLTFTVTTAPTNGAILVNGATSSTFTQADINMNLVTYTHDGSETLSDSFNFDVSDGSLDTSGTFSIAVTPVNDAPNLLPQTGNLITTNEDVDVVVNQGALGTMFSPSDAENDTWKWRIHSVNHGTITINGSNNFALPYTLQVSDVVRWTPPADANGSGVPSALNLSIIEDVSGLESPVRTLVIPVAAVNDAPMITQNSGQITSVEDAQGSYNGWFATSSGPSNESTQTTTIQIVSNSNPGLLPSVSINSGNGSLQFQPAANASGTATLLIRAMDTGGIANGGVNTSSNISLTIVILDVNDPPIISHAGNQSANEDSTQQTVNGFVTVLTKGSPFESSQTMSYQITNNSNPALFSIPPAIDASGNLTWTPAANANGNATINFVGKDDGGTAMVLPNTTPGQDTSTTQQFTITVNAVNDAPSFNKGPDVILPEDAPVQSIAGWATGISPGPSDESTQTVGFAVTVTSGASLFTVAPAISSTGTLTFTPAPNANGNATVSVTLSDNGGVTLGGMDTSAAQVFNITLGAVNDQPSFTASTPNDVNEDAGLVTVSNWASFTAGPADESTQTATYTVNNLSNPSLFAVAPAVDSSGNLTFTPATDQFGTCDISVFVTDSGGTANGGIDTSSVQVFTITVLSVNDVPVFTKGSDVSVAWDVGPQTVTGWASGLSAGPANESSQSLTFTITGNTDPSLFTSAPSIDSAGNLTFTPANIVAGTATISVTLSDDGGMANGGVDTSATQTFDITITGAPEADLTESSLPIVGNGSTHTMVSSIPTSSPTDVTFDLTNNGNDTLLLSGGVVITNAVNCQVWVTQSFNANSVSTTMTDSFIVQIIPSTIGAFSFDVSFGTNDADENPFAFTVSGVGHPAADIGVSTPTGLPVMPLSTHMTGPIGLGSSVSHKLRVWNFGQDDLTISSVVISDESNIMATANLALMTIGAGAESNLTLDLTSDQIGAYRAKVTITSNDPDTPTYEFWVNGETRQSAGPEIRITRGPLEIESGTVYNAGWIPEVGATRLRFTITNTGDATLSLDDMTLPTNLVNCAVTVFSAPSAMLVSGESTSVEFEVTPTVAGSIGFDYSLANTDADENPFVLLVSGTATATLAPVLSVYRNNAQITNAGSSDAGSVAGGDSVMLAYSVLNTGTAALNLQLPVVVSNLSNCTVTIWTQPSTTLATNGAWTMFGLMVTPTVDGPFGFDVTLNSNDPVNNPFAFAVAGVGPLPDIELQHPKFVAYSSGSTINVGKKQAGKSVSRTIFIHNRGTADLNVSNIAVATQNNATGSVGTPTATTIAPGDTAEVVVSVKIDDTGDFDVSFTVTSDDPDTPVYVIKLTGKGIEKSGGGDDSSCSATQSGSMIWWALALLGVLGMARFRRRET